MEESQSCSILIVRKMEYYLSESSQKVALFQPTGANHPTTAGSAVLVRELTTTC